MLCNLTTRCINLIYVRIPLRTASSSVSSDFPSQWCLCFQHDRSHYCRSAAEVEFGGGSGVYRSSGRATCLVKDEKASESGGGGAELVK